MSEKFGLIGLETVESRYLDGRTSMNCADRTAAEVDTEVMKILKECYDEAVKMLSENRDIMDKLAEFLIQKETITGHEFMEIYCKEKGIPLPKGEEPKNNNPETVIADDTFDAKASNSDSFFDNSETRKDSDDSFTADSKTGQNIDYVASDETDLPKNPGSESAPDEDDFSALLKNRTFRNDDSKQ